MIKVPRIPFLLEYPHDDPDEVRRHTPRENSNAKCRCGAQFMQYIVNPAYLASLRDGQRIEFLRTCERSKSSWLWPNQCQKCDAKWLGRRSA